MSIGVALLASPHAPNAIDDLVSQARTASAAGIGTAWLGQRFDYDAVAAAAIVGREVPGLAVGTSVVPIFGRHPVLLATTAQTAQAATGGRYTLGLGLGAKALTESAFGVPHERPIKRLREFITVLRSIFDTGHVDFEGETLTARTPLPATVAGANPVPIAVAAMGPQALRVTGELADGTLPLFAGPKTLENHIVPAITKAAEEAGRPAPRIIALVPTVVTSDVDAGKAKMAEETAFYDTIPSYQRVVALEGASKAAEVTVVGDEESVAAQLNRYFDAGATEVVLSYTGLTGEKDQKRTVELGGQL
ncbi:LLM class F420-dependent oxidoreductase [Amycolatopsis minnesotensis]|uniref:TIGR03564 family F420-dependent LLM class oxidoreductase n=1 Tax=Amycolatopsis minnesotensis TaxID=337894 RepID=A0ABN2S4E3_9PSEU